MVTSFDSPRKVHDAIRNERTLEYIAEALRAGDHKSTSLKIREIMATWADKSAS